MAESTPRFLANLAALFKLDVDYGTDSGPTGAANAIQFNDVTFVPMAGAEVSRNLLKPYMGHQGVFLTGHYATLQGSVELAGSGTAGNAPAFAALLKACGFAEVITAGTEVVYNPISKNFSSGTLYYNLDGVNHIMLGVRGSVSFGPLAPGQIPRMTFNLTGLSGTIADTVLPTVVHTGFITPVPVSKAMTSMSLFAWDAIAESIVIDAAVTVEPRFLIGEESIKITGRASTATAVVQAASLATKNWFALSKAHTKGVLAITHGITPGNIVKIDAPAVQLGRVTQGATQGIANYSLPLMLTPSVGNDEFKLTFR